MALDEDGMKGGIAILWQDCEVDLMGWRARHFSLVADFAIRGIEITGTIVNIYGLSAFPQKKEFLNHIICLSTSTS